MGDYIKRQQGDPDILLFYGLREGEEDGGGAVEGVDERGDNSLAAWQRRQDRVDEVIGASDLGFYGLAISIRVGLRPAAALEMTILIFRLLYRRVIDMYV